MMHAKTVVITGASMGLGEAIAQAFVQQGAQVLLAARNPEPLAETAHRLQALYQQTDVSQQAQVEALAETALKHWGRIDCWINNAGIYGPMGALEDISMSQWEEALAINLMGTVYGCRAAIGAMKPQKAGCIINVSGGGATQPLPFISAYAASKAAVVRFSETMALELLDTGITVNAIAPGALTTRLTDELLASGPSVVGEAFYNKMLQIKASGGTPVEKGAQLCVYLASDAAKGITGRLISAPWDPWPFDDAMQQQLAKTPDLYTLRRQV